MKVKELCELLGWELAYGNGDRQISGGIYCGDLLSLAIGRAPADGLWITVMGNVNAMAVASIADPACVVIAENMPFDEETKAGAEKGVITVARTDKPVFEAAMEAAKMLKLM